MKNLESVPPTSLSFFMVYSMFHVQSMELPEAEYHTAIADDTVDETRTSKVKESVRYYYLLLCNNLSCREERREHVFLR